MVNKFNVKQTGEINTFTVTVENGKAVNPAGMEKNFKLIKELLSIQAEPHDRMAQYISSIDFKLLKQQKTTIINLQAKLEKDSKYTQKEWDTLEGMINLIDSIQDIAVDEYGVKETKVFRISRKDK